MISLYHGGMERIYRLCQINSEKQGLIFLTFPSVDTLTRGLKLLDHLTPELPSQRGIFVENMSPKLLAVKYCTECQDMPASVPSD